MHTFRRTAHIDMESDSAAGMQVVMTETGEHRSVTMEDIIPASAACGTRSAERGPGSQHAADAGPPSSSSDEEEADDLTIQQQAQLAFCIVCLSLALHLLSRCVSPWITSIFAHTHTHTHTEGGRELPLTCQQRLQQRIIVSLQTYMVLPASS